MDSGVDYSKNCKNNYQSESPDGLVHPTCVLIGVRRLLIHTGHGSDCLSTSASGCDTESNSLVLSPPLQLSSGGVTERADKGVIHPVR